MPQEPSLSHPKAALLHEGDPLPLHLPHHEIPLVFNKVETSDPTNASCCGLSPVLIVAGASCREPRDAFGLYLYSKIEDPLLACSQVVELWCPSTSGHQHPWYPAAGGKGVCSISHQLLFISFLKSPMVPGLHARIWALCVLNGQDLAKVMF